MADQLKLFHELNRLVSTLAAGVSDEVRLRGTSRNWVLDFVIPAIVAGVTNEDLLHDIFTGPPSSGMGYGISVMRKALTLKARL